MRLNEHIPHVTNATVPFLRQRPAKPSDGGQGTEARALSRSERMGGGPPPHPLTHAPPACLDRYLPSHSREYAKNCQSWPPAGPRPLPPVGSHLWAQKGNAAGRVRKPPPSHASGSEHGEEETKSQFRILGRTPGGGHHLKSLLLGKGGEQHPRLMERKSRRAE